MLFQNTDDHPHLLMLACGDKTKTRRNSERWQMKVGGIYAAHDASKGLFQKKMDAPVFIRCIDRYKQRLGNTTDLDACAEGQYTFEEFKEVWIEINGEWNPARVVKVYVVEKVSACYACDRPDCIECPRFQGSATPFILRVKDVNRS